MPSLLYAMGDHRFWSSPRASPDLWAEVGSQWLRVEREIATSQAARILTSHLSADGRALAGGEASRFAMGVDTWAFLATTRAIGGRLIPGEVSTTVVLADVVVVAYPGTKALAPLKRTTATDPTAAAILLRDLVRDAVLADDDDGEHDRTAVRVVLAVTEPGFEDAAEVTHPSVRDPRRRHAGLATTVGASAPRGT